MFILDGRTYMKFFPNERRRRKEIRMENMEKEEKREKKWISIIR